MPTYPHIERYYEDKARYIQYGGSDNELSIRRAFANCLESYCREHKNKLALVDELTSGKGNQPDGTVKDVLRMAHGYWEAKDTHDDLDAEIQNKFNRGYPRDNIIFEDSQTAVLFQNGGEAMRVDMTRPDELHRLIRHFLDYELPQIEDFRKAREQFKTDLPAVLGNLRETIEEAERANVYFQESAARFLEHCRQSIGPAVSEADVREMLLQHILTKDIFLRVFGEDQFHKENNIAQELDALEATFFIGDVRREAIDRLRTYYGAIGRAADEIVDYAEKQQFLKALYEDFYKAYNPAAADRMGVVYTPNEVVDFIIRGTDWLLQKHFGRTLADENVQILDPATGTGTFVTNLINHLPLDRLEYKYLNEIHANELAILPYYIANLNIEYTYKERMGKYLEFPNLCFVDTLDNMDWQHSDATAGTVAQQSIFNLGAISVENWIRIQSQNEKPISVIMGNPPYNDQQSNWYERNPNRRYAEVDRRIKDTYIAESTAQRTHQYDMYKRFIRWASDRLADDGIIAFVTNRAYLDTKQDDGFRKAAAQEFTDIYVLDLGSDVRRNPRIAGTTHNVFGIQTGVAVGFLVREKDKLGQSAVHYARREDAELARDKLTYLRGAKLDAIAFEDITPDAGNNWLNQSQSDFESLLPLANRETKLTKIQAQEGAVFKLFSVGISTNRDEWVYDFSADSLAKKMESFCQTYANDLNRLYAQVESTDLEYVLATLSDSVDRSIKWTSELVDHLRRGTKVDYSDDNIVDCLYRPFVSQSCYYAPVVTHRRYQQPQIFPHRRARDNRVIAFPAVASTKPFSVLATDRLVDLHLLGDTQCLPLYRYTSRGRRVSNITKWGLNKITNHYRKALGDHFVEAFPNGITAEDVFAYTYAVLHDPVYRRDYEIDLKREFPRLPLYKDFPAWARMGQELLDLHIGFESAEPYPLERVDTAPRRSVKTPVVPAEAGTPANGAAAATPTPRTILRADKDNGRIVLDDVTTLTGVPADAWRYMLGSRSALEWVLDQYKERKPKDPTIAEKFDTYRFADYKEQVIDLLRRVCTVSVRTMDIVDGMAYRDGKHLVVSGDRDKDEWSLMGLEAMFSRPEDPAWEAEWSEI